MQKLNEIDDLIRIISKLPGLGPKSAKRIVLKLINNTGVGSVTFKNNGCASGIFGF